MDNIKKAFRAAEQELEEKDIAHLKGIIKNLLQKKKEKEMEMDEIADGIKIIKQDIEDFKAGRLDKIKERHDLNPNADKNSPISIVIINDNSRTVYPSRPWLWNYQVQWNHGVTYLSSGLHNATTTGNTGNNVTTTGSFVSQNTLQNIVNCSGQNAATFTAGTYNLNDGFVINL